jgi:hypothetical protein
MVRVIPSPVGDLPGSLARPRRQRRVENTISRVQPRRVSLKRKDWGIALDYLAAIWLRDE